MPTLWSCLDTETTRNAEEMPAMHFSLLEQAKVEGGKEMKEPKTFQDENGYLRFSDSKKLVHRWVAEKKIKGRPLEKGEIVHHTNGNKLDNRESNLVILDKDTHYKLHVVPMLEARREAQIKEHLVPTLEAQVIKAIASFFTIVGAFGFIFGLITRGKIETWYLGLGFLLIGLLGYAIQWRERRNES